MEGFIDYEKGDVVVFQFPFGDLNNTSKKRPSLIVAKLTGENVILCQITSQQRPNPYAIKLAVKDFQTGGIKKESFVSPDILFTIHKSRINYKAGKLKEEKIKEVQEKLCKIFTT